MIDLKRKIWLQSIFEWSIILLFAILLEELQNREILLQ